MTKNTDTKRNADKSISTAQTFSATLEGKSARSLRKNILAGVFSLAFSAGALSNDECVGKSMTLTLSPSECGKVEFGSDNVAVVGLDLKSLELEKPRTIEGDHVIVYIRRSESGIARGEIALREVEPIRENSGIKYFNVRGTNISAFKGEDQHMVYVTAGVNTFEGNRMVSENIQIFYRFSTGLKDFRDVDQKIYTSIKALNAH